jgi:hypothetical protein
LSQAARFKLSALLTEAVDLCYLGACFSGIVVNPVSIGHITSLDAPQNGQVKPCDTSFTLLYGPETLNVFWHFVQVTIFSILNSLLLLSSTGLSAFRAVVVTRPGSTPGICGTSI